jgi:serine phosphatase RsbU (regulator of sigma subunit)/tetratricopeptide (TPR) repeat protein
MNVINHLNTLEASGLVRLAQVVPDLEYLFRHNLVQDAAYASLLEQDQQRLHQAVGEALEILYADHLDEMAAALAHHFEQAGDHNRALCYFKRAAQAALLAYANPEAENLFRRAIRVAVTPEDNALLHGGLGEALYNLGRYDAAVETWDAGIRFASRTGDWDRVARLYARSARAAWFAGDVQRGLRLCEQGLETLHDTAETPGLAMLVHEAARACHFNGFPARALTLCRQALEMAERQQNIEVQADALSTLGILPELSPEEALSALHRSIELAESAGLLAIAARARLNTGSMTRFLIGDQEAARQHFMRSAEHSRRRGVVQEEFMALIGSISVSFQLGELDEAERALKQLEHYSRRMPNAAASQTEIEIFRAFLTSMRGEMEAGLAPLRLHAERARQRGDLQNLSNILSAQSDLLLETARQGALQDFQELEAVTLEYLSLAQRGQGSLGAAYANLAVLRALQKRFQEAHQALADGQKSPEPRYAQSNLVLKIAEIELAYFEGHLNQALDGYAGLQGKTLSTSRWHQARLDTSYAEALMQRGEPADLEHAQELLIRARAVFEKIGSRQMIALTQNLLETSRLKTLEQAQAQQKMTQELAMAGRIQSSFLPVQPPTLPGWEIAVCLRPARSTSGDYYDFISLPNERLGLVIADVADKGIGAALFMTSTRSLLRAYATGHPDQPDATLAAANLRITADTHGGLFVTLVYAILDPATGELWYCNAGHNPPLLYHSTGAEESLENTGVPLGVFEDARWGVERVQIDPGDTLVLYTDGITEAQNTRQALFGEQRLRQAVRQSAALPSAGRAEQVRATILQELEKYTAGAAQSDDITLLVLSRSA